MRSPLCLAASLLLAAASCSVAQAHFTILLPENASVRKAEPVRFDLFFGHPFEYALADMEPPAEVMLRTPSGGVRTITDAVELHRSLPLGSGKARTYRGSFRPDERGDWVLWVRTRAIEHGAQRQRDHVKVIVHVQAERGWDAVIGQPLEIVPLTRPYGLFPGVTLRGQVFANGAPLEQGFAYVSVERYNTERPRRLPPEERITRTERTGPQGTFAVTLPEPGWWVLAAERIEPEQPQEQVRERALLWIHVPPPAPPAPERG